MELRSNKQEEIYFFENFLLCYRSLIDYDATTGADLTSDRGACYRFGDTINRNGSTEEDVLPLKAEQGVCRYR